MKDDFRFKETFAPVELSMANAGMYFLVLVITK